MPRSKLSKATSNSSSKTRPKAPPITWIRTLAEPYLRGFRPRAEARGALRGYRFFSPGNHGTRARVGVFVGYALKQENLDYLNLEPPESMVFIFIEPVNSPVYVRLVTAEGSLLRRASEYISWLTHRRPRFAFFEKQANVLVRHSSMKDWPAEKQEHFSRNFFIETLAWLVRSGLVAKLASGKSAPQKRSGSGRHKTILPA
jgi:hypothetical protein